MIKLGSNSIGSLYLGTNSIGKAYLGSNLIFQKGSGPTPITTIPYIRGGADGSYIDTGITADNTVRVIVWARNWNPNSYGLFGSRIAYNNKAFCAQSTDGANSGAIRFDYNSANTYSYDAFALFSGYHKYEINGNQFLVDDTAVITQTAATFDNNLNIHLFGVNTDGTHTNMLLPADICACKIYKNSVLVRDFTAVDSPSVGLYDSVSETLFTNAGNGSFTYGTFNENAYIPLTYIECDGNQYFDSGIRGSNALNYVAKFSPAGNKWYPWLFGAQTSSSSKRYGFAFGDSTTPYSVFYFVHNTSIIAYTYGASTTGKALVAVKNGNTAYLYEDNTQKTSQSLSGTFTTDYNIYVGTVNTAESISSGGHYGGKIHFLGFGSSRNFVPAKVNNVAGMYDTYNDAFYSSTSGAQFTAGPEL